MIAFAWKLRNFQATAQKKNPGTQSRPLASRRWNLESQEKKVARVDRQSTRDYGWERTTQKY